MNEELLRDKGQLIKTSYSNHRFYVRAFHGSRRA